MSKQKLVRDNIPEIMKKLGKKCNFKVANEEEYKKFLFDKLIEECNELVESKNNYESMINEMTDVLEVIDAIKNTFNLKEEDIQSFKLNKKNQNGGFDKKYIMNLPTE